LAAGDLHAVTGAFGYSGSRIATRLLAAGRRVRTLTNAHRRDHALADRVDVRPLRFDDTPRLAAALEGVSVLYNTYWVRFNHRGFNFATAIENSRTLFAAARTAGVARIVHVSITNPSEDSPFEYFRGKALVERALRETAISHAILRPAVLFGGEDILINNIAWALRHLPVFGVFGDGSYRLQPIHVDDFADLAVAAGGEHDTRVIDAIGPEMFTFRELVETLARTIGVRRPIVSVPPALGYAAGTVLGHMLGDVLITREEIVGLMQGLLATDSPPVGRIRLSEWAQANARTLGRVYANELARRRG
jgi:NADH dehydrogenase